MTPCYGIGGRQSNQGTLHRQVRKNPTQINFLNKYYLRGHGGTFHGTKVLLHEHHITQTMNNLFFICGPNCEQIYFVIFRETLGPFNNRIGSILPPRYSSGFSLHPYQLINLHMHMKAIYGRPCGHDVQGSDYDGL